MTKTQSRRTDAAFYQKEINAAETQNELLDVLKEIAMERYVIGIHRVNKLRLNLGRKLSIIQKRKNA